MMTYKKLILLLYLAFSFCIIKHCVLWKDKIPIFPDVLPALTAVYFKTLSKETFEGDTYLQSLWSRFGIIQYLQGPKVGKVELVGTSVEIN